MNRLQEIGRVVWRRVKAFVLSWDALVFICFVAVAAVLWYGQALTSTRQMTMHVPIVYEGVPQDVAFAPALPDHVDVTIRDAGRRLIEQHEEVPVLTFDLSDQIKGSKGKVHISNTQIYQKLPSALQGSGTAQVIGIYPDAIESNYSERFNELKYTFPVETRKVPAGYRLVLFPAQVEVYARVSQSHYGDVSAKDITVYCEYPSSGDDEKLPVRFIHRSKYIKSIRIVPSEVEYLIERSER